MKIGQRIIKSWEPAFDRKFKTSVVNEQSMIDCSCGNKINYAKYRDSESLEYL